MILGKRLTVLTLKMLFIIGALFTLGCTTAYAEYVTVTDTFEAGTRGNGAVFTVRNNSAQHLTGVRMTPQFPLQYCTLTGIKPESATLEPGESVQFTIEFSVHADAPSGAKDTITLFFDTNEKVEIDHPRYQINIDIVGSDEKRKHNTAYFKVLVQGSGYEFYPGGSREVSGSGEQSLVIKRGENIRNKLMALKNSIDGEPCKLSGPWTTVAEAGTPGLFTHGSQITVVDGPYYDFNEFSGKVKYAKNWRITNRNGPSAAEVEKRFGCQ